jgi:predicted enzyme related to lactoylglutathione lyase
MSAAENTFAWFVLSTSNPKDAIAFYRKLFGWQAMEAPIGSLLVTSTGMPVGSVVEHRNNAFARREPVNWFPMVRVLDVQAATARVADAGGKVWVPPYDTGLAEVAVIRGASGEAFGFWQPIHQNGVPLVADPRVYAWFELVTPEPERAASFYRAVLGWRIADEGGYTFIGNASGQFGGIVKLEGDWEDYAFLAAIGRARGEKLDVPPHWMVFFAVDDCEAFMDEAEALGAQVTTRAEPLHTIGTFAVARDPQGAYFSVLSKR